MEIERDKEYYSLMLNSIAGLEDDLGAKYVVKTMIIDFSEKTPELGYELTTAKVITVIVHS